MEEIQQPKWLGQTSLYDMKEFGSPTLADIVKHFADKGANFDHVVLEQDYDHVYFAEYDRPKPLSLWTQLHKEVQENFVPLFERYKNLTFVPVFVYGLTDFEWEFNGFAETATKYATNLPSLDLDLLKQIDDETNGEFEYKITSEEIQKVLSSFGRKYYGPLKFLAMHRVYNKEEDQNYYSLRSHLCNRQFNEFGGTIC
jgi:hypothetical protein